jgi:hypothetical protein
MVSQAGDTAKKRTWRLLTIMPIQAILSSSFCLKHHDKEKNKKLSQLTFIGCLPCVQKNCQHPAPSKPHNDPMRKYINIQLYRAKMGRQCVAQGLLNVTIFNNTTPPLSLIDWPVLSWVWAIPPSLIESSLSRAEWVSNSKPCGWARHCGAHL